MVKPMMATMIPIHGKMRLLVCDGACNKAWGIQLRPREQLSDDEDDFAWLADDELGLAPAMTGETEGGHDKPRTYAHNKWCARQCERSVIIDLHGVERFDQRVPNKKQ